MNLYLIAQKTNTDYDTFDSAVVAAQSTEEAKQTYPGYPDIIGIPDTFLFKNSYGIYESAKYLCDDWAFKPSQVKAEYIGKAKEGTKAGVILASFNAG